MWKQNEWEDHRQMSDTLGDQITLCVTGQHLFLLSHVHTHQKRKRGLKSWFSCSTCGTKSDSALLLPLLWTCNHFPLLAALVTFLPKCITVIVVQWLVSYTFISFSFDTFLLLISPNLSRMSLTSCVLCVTPVQMCSCCALAWSVPPLSRTFLRSGSQRYGDTPHLLHLYLLGHSVTFEKMSRCAHICKVCFSCLDFYQCVNIWQFTN